MANILGISAVPFLFAFIGSSLFVAIPLFILKLGVTDPFVLGLAGASFQISYMTFCILHSVFSRYINRRKAIIAASLIYPVILLGLILTQNLSFIFLLCALQGAALSMFWPTYESHITINVDRSRATKNLQIFNIGWSSGAVLGCLLGGIIFSIHARGVFYFNLIISLIAIPMAIRYIFGHHVGRVSDNEFLPGQEDIDRNPITSSGKAKQFLVIGWMGSFVLWASIGIIIWLFPKFAIDRGISSAFIGVLRAIPGFFQTITFLILGRYQRWQYSFSHLAVFEFMLILTFIILAVSSSLMWWTLGFAIMGIATGFIYSSSLFYSAQARTEKGEKTGFHEAVLISGSLFGTFFGGIISRAISINAAYLACIGLIVVCIALQSFIRVKAK